MSLIETPCTYQPKFNVNTQAYEDQPIYDISKGIVCPCYATKTFYKRDSFSSHWKSQKHKKWMNHLNENSVNYYEKCVEYEQTIRNLQILLTRSQNELKQKDVIIQYLEEQKVKAIESELMNHD